MTQYIFGYGSLVNLGTHAYEDPAPARLKGWRRHWCGSDQRMTAFLTVVRDDDNEIDGLIARVPPAEWNDLDSREYAYDRADVMSAVTPVPGSARDLVTYHVPEDQQIAGENRPINLSYIDVVVQGYLNAYGKAGALRFFETTTGWDVPVINDRQRPRYSRHQALNPDERKFVDDQIAGLAAMVYELK